MTGWDGIEDRIGEMTGQVWMGTRGLGMREQTRCEGTTASGNLQKN